MIHRFERRVLWAGIDIIALFLCALFAFPLLIGVLNSVKPLSDIIFEPLSIDPAHMSMDAYVAAFDRMKYAQRFINSALITVVSVSLSVLMSSMAAFKLARGKTRLSRGLYRGSTVFMLIPFNCTMISMTVIMTRLGLIDTYPGAVLGYLAYLGPMSIFLYHGYIRSIPATLDESARIDGCGLFSIYRHIIFPLIAPMTATVVILNTFHVWNDYLYPLLILQSEAKKTLVTGLASFSNKHMQQWDKLLAATVLVVLPVMVVYGAMQRRIVSGMVTGAVKE